MINGKFMSVLALSAMTLAACGKGEMKDDAMSIDTMAVVPAETKPIEAMPTAGTENPMVGGAAMYANKDIVDNAVNSADHTPLVAAVKAAGLVETLKGAGPFTVFAPTNDAFENLPAGTVETLLKPEKKPDLTKVLTYHVVAGKFTADDIAKAIQQGGGKAELKTVS